MPRTLNATYYSRRARQSSVAADASADPGARLAHLQLASAYQALAAAEGDAASAMRIRAEAGERAA